MRGARIKSRDAEDGEEGAGSPGLGGGKERGEESSDQSSTTSQEDILGKQVNSNMMCLRKRHRKKALS